VDVFDLRDRLVQDYGRYTESFINIADPRVKAKVQGALDGGALWPEPLLQLNPTFLPGGTIEDLVADGTLHPECARIFRIDKSEADHHGKPLLLHTHQTEAIRKARDGRSYVLTSGTGSGKSLTYIVPIVDHVLRRGPGRGVQAIVVYPMNALANSQSEELKKFLERGYPEGQAPVRFARYTGQEKGEAREALRNNPPDVLLTNYMMLELLLTRHEDRAIVRAAQGLRFLVFDELHTYRGRQGADIALLIRRTKLALEARDAICVGTSATMGGGGTWSEQRKEVARVATTLFGSDVDAAQVVGETLERATPPLPGLESEVAEALRRALDDTPTPPDTYESFTQHPLASWIESTFGVQPSEDGTRLIRQRPRRLYGSDGAAGELAQLTGKDEKYAGQLLQAFLLRGSELRRPSGRFPVFAFRLHQFLTRGDTVWATIEAPDVRHLETAKLVCKPGEPEKPLFPLVFCRQCGTEYYRVAAQREGAGGYLQPREDRTDPSSNGSTNGYLYGSDAAPWPGGDGPALLARLPEFMKTTGKDGAERVSPDARKDLPQAVFVDHTGCFTAEGEGVPAAFIPGNFLFCLNPGCGVAYARTQRSERAKLATLGVDNRSTATTILAVRTLVELQADRALPAEARKLLSFTDNRQDASLQAGHFNDFAQVALLRSALFKAVKDKGEAGLGHAELAPAIFAAMHLPLEEYAANPTVRGPARTATNDALMRVIQYHVYRDLQRLWRVTAPNLEDCGLLRFEYDGLRGHEGLLSDEDVWTHAVPVEQGRQRIEVESPFCLRECPAEVREEIVLTLLDVLRRNVAVKVDVLDPQKQRELVDQTQPRLLEGTVWYLGDTRDLVQAAIAWPRPKRAQEHSGLFVSSYGGFGRYLRRTLRRCLPAGVTLTRDDIDAAIQHLFHALTLYGILERVRGGDGEVGGFQINPAALRWLEGEGSVRPVDRTRLLEVGEVPPAVNEYFTRTYREFVELQAVLEAREHTAQVAGEDREAREERFRSADLPLLFCSPTMELGVDIAQLNVVNLRNVPPTPANYAQRSGRAGRGGQPALVYTYCAGRSPHDQYFFREPEAMVAGVVAAPRIDLRNADLLRAHLHAMWMEVATPDLGKTLTSVLDVPAGGTHLELPVRSEVQRVLNDPALRRAAQAKAEALMADLRPHLDGAAWFHDQWMAGVFEQLARSFDDACQRWRELYRAAVRQRELHHRILFDHSRPEAERRASERLRAHAESQIRLLTEAEGIYEGDFYSYRYFAAEGFLPGYNFPRLPLSAYVPGHGRTAGRDEFLSRPRFLAISEFGPRALVYHEGSRYRVYKVNLDFGTPDVEGTHTLPTVTMKRCGTCGYAHVERGAHLQEMCDRCGSALDSDSVIPELVQMQNVSLRLAQRITCDEEERQRFGYRLVTAYRFPTYGSESERRDADVVVDGATVMRLSYGDATSLYRVNLGWAHQRSSQAPGFLLDLERGFWSTNALDQDDAEEGAQGRQKRVVPYVEDSRNALVVQFEPTPRPADMAALQSALKAAIQQVYQIEPRELSAEPLPSASDRRQLLFYEAAEGGAGVLRQLVEDPQAIARVARRALSLCHFDPDTLEDEESGRCGRACYACLLDYGNQPDHTMLDRFAIRDLLHRLAAGECRPAGGAGTREARLRALRQRCDSGLEKRWLERIEALLLRPPSHGQYLVESASTRPDFFYDDLHVAIYVDGPVHDTAEALREDEDVTQRLQAQGYAVIRFHHAADWDAIFRAHPDVFGTPRS
jgi:ATP-dependent helicase YprA (DUF1998 family)/very-short-patch-repair endonuclease